MAVLQWHNVPRRLEHIKKHVCTGKITDWKCFPCLFSEICCVKEDDWALNAYLLCWGKQLVCSIYLGQTLLWAFLRCFTPRFPDHYWKVNGRAVSGHCGGTFQPKFPTKWGNVLSIIQTKYRISFKCIDKHSGTGLNCAFLLAVVSPVMLLVRQSFSLTSSFSLMYAHLLLCVTHYTFLGTGMGFIFVSWWRLNAQLCINR